MNNSSLGPSTPGPSHRPDLLGDRSQVDTNWMHAPFTTQSGASFSQKNIIVCLAGSRTQTTAVSPNISSRDISFARPSTPQSRPGLQRRIAFTEGDNEDVASSPIIPRGRRNVAEYTSKGRGGNPSSFGLTGRGGSSERRGGRSSSSSREREAQTTSTSTVTHPSSSGLRGRVVRTSSERRSDRSPSSSREREAQRTTSLTGRVSTVSTGRTTRGRSRQGLTGRTSSHSRGGGTGASTSASATEDDNVEGEEDEGGADEEETQYSTGRPETPNLSQATGAMSLQWDSHGLLDEELFHNIRESISTILDENGNISRTQTFNPDEDGLIGNDNIEEEEDDDDYDLQDELQLLGDETDEEEESGPSDPLDLTEEEMTTFLSRVVKLEVVPSKQS